MKNWLEKVVAYGTYLTVFLVPLLYFGGKLYIPYTTSKTFFFYGIVEIVFTCWMYLILVDKRYRLSKKVWIFFSPLSILIGWLTITGISGVSPEMSFWSSLGRGTGLLALYQCLALSVVLASLIKAKGYLYIKHLLFWFLGGAFLLVLSVWFGDEGFNLPFEFLQKSKGGGLIGNSSLTAGYLIFAFYFTLFMLFSNVVTNKLKIWSGILLGLIIFSPLFLNIYGLISFHKLLISARGAMLGIGIGLGVGVLGYFFLSQQRFVRFFSILGIIVCLGVFGWSWNRLETSGNIINQKFTESATASRLIFWNIAKQGIAEKPILGWGPENYSVVYQKYFDTEILKQSESSVEVWVDRPHNVFYEIGIAGGYLAIVLYCIFIASLIFGAYRAYQLAKINRFQVSILWGLITGYIFQNLFVFDSLSSYLGLFVLVALTFGLIDNPNIDSQKKDNTTISKDYINYIINPALVIMLVIGLFYFVVMPYRKVARISEIFTLSLNKRPEQYKNLLKISPVGNSWEIGRVAEDAYQLYSNNFEKIKKDPQLLSYVLIDLEKFLEYLDIISKKEPYEYRLYLNMMRLSNIYMNLSGGNNPDLTQRISDLAEYARDLSPNHFNLIYTIKH